MFIDLPVGAQLARLKEPDPILSILPAVLTMELPRLPCPEGLNGKSRYLINILNEKPSTRENLRCQSKIGARSRGLRDFRRASVAREPLTLEFASDGDGYLAISGHFVSQVPIARRAAASISGTLDSTPEIDIRPGSGPSRKICASRIPPSAYSTRIVVLPGWE